jgi:hypothetical protein
MRGVSRGERPPASGQLFQEPCSRSAFSLTSGRPHRVVLVRVWGLWSPGGGAHRVSDHKRGHAVAGAPSHGVQREGSISCRQPASSVRAGALGGRLALSRAARGEGIASLPQSERLDTSRRLTGAQALRGATDAGQHRSEKHSDHALTASAPHHKPVGLRSGGNASCALPGTLLGETSGPALVAPPTESFRLPFGDLMARRAPRGRRSSPATPAAESSGRVRSLKSR